MYVVNQKLILILNTDRLKVKRWSVSCINTNQKHARVGILILDKANFSARKSSEIKRASHKDKGVNSSNKHMILNVYIPINYKSK